MLSNFSRHQRQATQGRTIAKWRLLCKAAVVFTVFGRRLVMLQTFMESRSSMVSLRQPWFRPELGSFRKVHSSTPAFLNSPALLVSFLQAPNPDEPIDAHIQFNRWNFSQPCQDAGCVEDKIRTPARGSRRSGFRIHRPFGPPSGRSADGSHCGLLFADAYFSVLWVDTPNLARLVRISNRSFPSSKPMTSRCPVGT